MILHLEEALIRIETNNGKVTGVVTDKRTVPADIVVLGLGLRPNTALAKAVGVPLGEKGAIKVNAWMESEVAGIWGRGRPQRSFHLVSRNPSILLSGP